MTHSDAPVKGTYTKLKKDGVWGCRVEKEEAPGTILDVSVVRKDGTSETRKVEIFWVGGGVSLGNFLDD